VIVMEFAWLIIIIGVVAVTARLFLLYHKNNTATAIAAKGELVRQEQQELAAARLAAKRAHEIEVARAGATVIQNVIDPAPFVAAALTALGVQPQPQPVTIRAEVER